MYPSLLKGLSPEAINRIDVLEKSDLIYTLKISTAEDQGTLWTSEGATIYFDPNDNFSFPHELGGHGYQRDIFCGQACEMVEMYENDINQRLKWEEDAYNISGDEMDFYDYDYYINNDFDVGPGCDE